MEAAIDAVSGDGRHVIGVGSGAPIDEPEHRAFGFPNLSPADRRAHLEEWVTALRDLFRGRPYPGGAHVPAVPRPLLPPPPVPPPVWVGCQVEAVVHLPGPSAPRGDRGGRIPHH